MGKIKIKLGLAAKFIIAVTTLLIVTISILSLFSINHEKKAMLRALEERGLSLAGNLAYNCEYGVLTSNIGILSDLVAGAMKQPDVVCCVVEDSDGIRLVSRGLEDKLTLPDRIIRKVLGAEEPMVQNFTLAGKDYIDISAPVKTKADKAIKDEEAVFQEQGQAVATEKKIGVVRVGLSLRNTNILIRKAQQGVTVISVVIILISALVTILLTGVALVPIKKLVEATQKIAKGDLAYKVEVKSRDELGDLAQSLNKMSEDLQKTTVSRNDLIKEVEKRKRNEELIRQINVLQSELLKPGNIEEKAKIVTDAVVRIFDVDFCRIWIIQPADLCNDCMHAALAEGPHVCRSRERCLHLISSSGRYTHIDGKGHRRVPLGAYKIGRIAIDKERKFLTNDVTNDPRVHNHEWAKELGLVSFAGYQLRPPDGDFMGVLALFSKQRLSTEDDGLLEGLGNAVAQMIRAARAEEGLREYTSKVEEVNHELDDFTYIVSHDLKEPLRSVDAFSKFIATDYKEKLDEEGRGYLERIRANANRMKELIDDLLEISRIDRKKNPLEEVEAGEIINDVKLRLDFALKQKNAELVVTSQLPKIFCDKVRLAEVFYNLVSNAVKFNDKPAPRIEIGYDLKGDLHQFSVRDNGPGIEEKYFDKIFQIFQRLVKKEEYEGTGAGLTIVKKVVEMHRGKIWVESKVGEYTAFYFTIPVNKDFILAKKKIGEILVEKKLVSEEDVNKALEEQRGVL